MHLLWQKYPLGINDDMGENVRFKEFIKNIDILKKTDPKLFHKSARVSGFSD